MMLVSTSLNSISVDHLINYCPTTKIMLNFIRKYFSLIFYQSIECSQVKASLWVGPLHCFYASFIYSIKA